jgi:capsule polysaccharide export protein KpsE/RkpR
MTDTAYLPATDGANPRTEAALARLRKAMADIEADIAAHQGVYPFNHGRVTQSELCRRADVKKATLQTPLHKDTTRVRILAWLDTVSATVTQTRDATREKVTAVADGLAADVERLQAELQAALLQLGLAEQRIQALEAALASARTAADTPLRRGED